MRGSFRCAGVWLVLFLSYLSFVDGAKQEYGIVVDLGSKGSRVGVFVWPSDAKYPYAEVTFGGGKNPWYLKINPGVTMFAENPAGAGPYLKPLLDYAQSTVPSSQLATTPIFVRGTDTLRRLPGGASEAILLNIFGYIQKNYGFLMPSNTISLLSGNQEGGFLWVSVNYLLGTFAAGKKPIGALDMGSGSTQITFIPKSGTVVPPGYDYEFVYKKDTYAPYVYSHSGYGYLASIYALNLTLTLASPSSKVILNPCLLNGYSATSVLAGRTVILQGTGSWSQCADLMFSYLNTNAPCSYPPCSFAGAFQPPLQGNYLAVSNFADVVDILGLGDKATVQEIINGGVKFCALSWAEAQKKYPDADPEELYTFCFGANYISTLLSKGYGFPLDTKLEFGKKYEKAPYSWTLGAMVYELQHGWTNSSSSKNVWM